VAILTGFAAAMGAVDPDGKGIVNQIAKAPDNHFTLCLGQRHKLR
jgi:hypothetical protein